MDLIYLSCCLALQVVLECVCIGNISAVRIDRYASASVRETDGGCFDWPIIGVVCYANKCCYRLK